MSRGERRIYSVWTPSDDDFVGSVRWGQRHNSDGDYVNPPLVDVPEDSARWPHQGNWILEEEAFGGSSVIDLIPNFEGHIALDIWHVIELMYLD